MGPYVNPYSCVLCKRRKVKCDKHDPCANCTKAHAECIFQAPAPPRRRKKKSVEQILSARVQHCEELLKRHGVNLEPDHVGHDLESTASSTAYDESTAPSPMDNHVETRRDILAGGPAVSGTGHGRLIIDKGRSNYIENQLWSSITDKVHDSHEIFDESSEDEVVDPISSTLPSKVNPDGLDLILGYSGSKESLSSLHPSPAHASKLWKVFLENVNALIKLLHAPSFAQDSFRYAGSPEGTPRSVEVLLFAIYLSAVMSLTDTECNTLFEETRVSLVARYQYATQQALRRAVFLESPDMMVLQGYVLFLLSNLAAMNYNSMWMLTGIAVRKGQQLGLHRDATYQQVSVFEAEMRRRLWWQIVVMDGRCAQLCGAGASVLANCFDTKVPLNLNDSDLSPEMRELPGSREGATEMMFCLLRYTIGAFFLGARPNTSFDGIFGALSSTDLSFTDKDKSLDELEQILERKFLRYCDPLVPLHIITSGVARAALCRMRFIAHFPRWQQGNGHNMQAEERSMLFNTSIKLLEYDNLVVEMNSIRRYLWHTRANFQWGALVHLLSELRERCVGEDVERAWQQIELVFERRTELLMGNNSKALVRIVRKLVIQAWEFRKSHHAAQPGQPVVKRPDFIERLYIREAAAKTRSSRMSERTEEAASANTADIETDKDGFGSTMFRGDVAMEFSPIDWTAWETLVNEFDGGNGEGADGGMGMSLFDLAA